jgi:hypothetical protein
MLFYILSISLFFFNIRRFLFFVWTRIKVGKSERVLLLTKVHLCANILITVII